MNKKILGKSDILEAQDIKIELMDVPEWNGSIYVKTLTGAERDKLEASIMSFGNDGRPRGMKLDNMRAMVAVLGICDEKGDAIFTMKDITALSAKSSSALDRVVAKIQSLAAMSQLDIENLIGDLKNDQHADLLTA